MVKTFLGEIKEKLVDWITGDPEQATIESNYSEHWSKFKVTEPRPKTADSKHPEMLLLHGLFGALSNWEGVLPLFSNYSHPIALQLSMKISLLFQRL